MNHYYPKMSIEIKLYNENKDSPHIELIITDVKYSQPTKAYMEPDQWAPCEITDINQQDRITKVVKRLHQTANNSHIHKSYKLANINDDVNIRYADGNVETIQFPEYDDIERPFIFKEWKGGGSMDLYWHTNGKMVSSINPGTKQNYILVTPWEWRPLEDMGNELYPLKEELYDEYKIYSYYHDPDVRYVTGNIFMVDKELSMGGFQECLLEECQ